MGGGKGKEKRKEKRKAKKRILLVTELSICATEQALVLCENNKVSLALYQLPKQKQHPGMLLFQASELDLALLGKGIHSKERRSSLKPVKEVNELALQKRKTQAVGSSPLRLIQHLVSKQHGLRPSWNFPTLGRRLQRSSRRPGLSFRP